MAEASVQSELVPIFAGLAVVDGRTCRTLSGLALVDFPIHRREAWSALDAGLAVSASEAAGRASDASFFHQVEAIVADLALGG